MADTVSGDVTINGEPAHANPTNIPMTFSFPSQLPQPPFIDVGGIPNFRDLGGYLTASSYFSSNFPLDTTPVMVRKQFIYRCAHPQLVTEKGQSQIAHDLGIRHFFDFRSAPEVRKLSASIPATAKTDATTNTLSKVLEIPGTQRHFVPVYEEDSYGPDSMANKVEWYTSSPAVHEESGLKYPYADGFVKAYRDIAVHAAQSTRNNAAYPTVLRQIIDHPDQPIVFHCTAGKDRTGVLAALLLRLCGVDDETIAWEYALTEPGLGEWRAIFIDRIARGGMGQAGAPDQKIIDETGKEVLIVKPKMQREEAARIVGAKGANMRAFLKIVVDGEFGGVDRYFTEQCGLSQDDVAILKKNLLVPVTEENARQVVMPRNLPYWTPDGGVQDQ